MNKRRTKKCRNKITKNYRNNNNSNGEGSRIYTLDGHFTTDPKLLHKGKYIFRKMTNDIGEKKICELLMNNPHKNIIKIYGIGKHYIDMELLNTDMDSIDKSVIKTKMLNVATQSKGGEMKRGYGAARTSGMGLQDENLQPGKSMDYYKDLI